MAIYTKELLSASINGRQIPISGSGIASANIIHSGVAGTSSLQECYIYCQNIWTGDILFTMSWGGQTSGDLCITNVPAQVGRVIIADGKLIQNGLSISGWANFTGLNIDGFVNRIS